MNKPMIALIVVAVLGVSFGGVQTYRLEQIKTAALNNESSAEVRKNLDNAQNELSAAIEELELVKYEAADLSNKILEASNIADEAGQLISDSQVIVNRQMSTLAELRTWRIDVYAYVKSLEAKVEALHGVLE
jgi:methyl-accepting chemotaxis protein